MKMKTLVLASAIAAFVTPFSAGASDKASSTGAGGAEKMFHGLDKNKDGFLSKDEVKGTPHDKDFAKLDKNSDGKLSRDEYAAAPEHAGDKSATGATGATSGTTGSSASGSSGSPSKKY
jgi:hypothetical protein